MAERVVRVRLSAAVSEYEQSMLSAARATATVGTESEKLAQKRQAFDQMGRGLVVTGVALTAVTALSVKAAMGWESAWAGVTKTVEGTPEQLARVEDGLRGLTSVLPASHDEIAAVAEAAGQLGVETGSVVEFTRTMIDMGETTNLSANDAATALARFMNIMGTSQDQASNLGSAIVGLGNNYATTEAEIMEMAMRLAGAGSQIGLSEGQVLGLSTALSSVGIEAEAGGSAMSKVMIDIAASVEEGGARLDQFAKTAGMSAQDFAAQWKSDPAAALAAFVKGLSNAETQGQSTLGILAELGITEVRMRDALLRSSAAADQFAGAMTDGNRAFDENNALTLEAAKRYETVESKIAIAGNAVRDAAIDFGEVFLPAVAGAADAVSGFAGFMGDLPDPVQGILGVLGGVAGMIALTGGTALLAIPKINEFRAALEGMKWSMRGVALAGGGAMIALTALVAVVGGLSAAHAAAEQKAQSYADTLAEGTQKVTKATREMIAANLVADQSFLWVSQGSLADNAEALGLSLSTVTDAIAGNADALEEVNEAINGGLLEATKQMKDADLAAYDAATLLKAGIEAEVGALDAAAVKARQAEDAVGGTAEATDDLSEATAAAEKELSGMVTALEDVAGAAMSLGDSHDRALSAINSMREAAEQEGVALDGVNDASIRFRDSLRDVEQKHRDSAQAIAETGGTLEAAQAEWDAGRESVLAMLEQMLGSREAAVQWADANLGAAGEVSAALAGVKAAAESIPPAKVIDLSITGTSAVYNELMRVQDALRSVTGSRSLHVSTGQGGQGGLVAGNANGGIYENKVKTFASGGFEPGVYPYAPGGIHKFAEEYSEAYISMDPARRQRSVGVWMQAGQHLGVLGSGQQSAPVQVSLAGAEFTLLVDGNPVRAIVQEQIVSADRESGRVIDRGRRG